MQQFGMVTSTRGSCSSMSGSMSIGLIRALHQEISQRRLQARCGGCSGDRRKQIQTPAETSRSGRGRQLVRSQLQGPCVSAPALPRTSRTSATCSSKCLRGVVRANFPHFLEVYQNRLAEGLVVGNLDKTSIGAERCPKWQSLDAALLLAEVDLEMTEMPCPHTVFLATGGSRFRL